MEFADIRCDPVVIERSRHDIAVDGGAFYFLTLQLEGVGRVSQRGREVTLQPGEFTLVDSTEPYVLRFDLPVHRLIVRVPQGELDCRIRSGIDLRAVRFAAHVSGHAWLPVCCWGSALRRTFASAGERPCSRPPRSIC